MVNVNINITEVECVHGDCRWLALRIMKLQLEVAPWHSLDEKWDPINSQ